MDHRECEILKILNGDRGGDMVGVNMPCEGHASLTFLYIGRKVIPIPVLLVDLRIHNQT
jgi:hypothetical protein